jgi:SAM-dependent methyltransferase
VWGIKLFVKLDAGVTRGEVWDPQQQRIRAQARQLEQMRRKLSEQDRQAALWEAGKEEEVEWWREWLVTEGQIWRPEEYRSSLNPEQPLQDYVVEHLNAPPGATVSILDVGAGPLTKLGKRWEGRTVHITAVDPLAYEYQRLLAEVDITPLTQTQLGEAERLTERFPTNHFDLVHMQNALDHSYDPLLGIREMLDVVKPGCCVLLLHFANEAEMQGYEGLHQWNLCADSGNFVIWNRDTRFSVNEALGDAAQIAVSESEVDKNEEEVVKGEILVSLKKNY